MGARYPFSRLREKVPKAEEGALDRGFYRANEKPPFSPSGSFPRKRGKQAWVLLREMFLPLQAGEASGWALQRVGNTCRK